MEQKRNNTAKMHANGSHLIMWVLVRINLITFFSNFITKHFYVLQRTHIIYDLYHQPNWMHSMMSHAVMFVFIVMCLKTYMICNHGSCCIATTTLPSIFFISTLIIILFLFSFYVQRRSVYYLNEEKVAAANLLFFKRDRTTLGKHEVLWPLQKF